jgi:hypothetical protein
MLGLFFASALFNACLPKNGIELEKQPWPAAKNCETCVPVQFGKLEMRLPIAEIGKILVHGSDASALHILPKTNNPREGVVFLTVKPENLLGKYQKLGFLQGRNITTNEQLFDALGKPPVGKTPFIQMRRIEHIDTAQRYLKTSKDALHVYWIQASPPDSQYVYFVIDGQETVYFLTGNVTQEFYEAVLSNLRVVDVP